MTRDEAIDKAAKAHRLATRPGTEAEGAVAATMRDRIMAANGITLADVEAKILLDENPRAARASRNAAWDAWWRDASRPETDSDRVRREAREAEARVRQAAAWVRAQARRANDRARRETPPPPPPTGADNAPSPGCNCDQCRAARRAARHAAPRAAASSARGRRAAGPKATPEQAARVRDMRAAGHSFRHIDEVVFGVYDRKGWVSFSVARRAGIK